MKTATFGVQFEVNEEFLRDVLCTALEGGIGYWSQVSDIHRVGDYPDGKWSYDWCLVHPLDEDEEGYDKKGVVLNLDKIIAGIGIVLSDRLQWPYLYRMVGRAVADNDAGVLDAGDADSIVQLGLWGQVIYG